MLSLYLVKSTRFPNDSSWIIIYRTNHQVFYPSTNTCRGTVHRSPRVQQRQTRGRTLDARPVSTVFRQKHTSGSLKKNGKTFSTTLGYIQSYRHRTWCLWRISCQTPRYEFFSSCSRTCSGGNVAMSRYFNLHTGRSTHHYGDSLGRSSHRKKGITGMASSPTSLAVSSLIARDPCTN